MMEEENTKLSGQNYRLQLVIGNLQTRIAGLERENAFLAADLELARLLIKKTTKEEKK